MCGGERCSGQHRAHVGVVRLHNQILPRELDRLGEFAALQVALETRVRPASHWPNSQLASEAATVSRMRMTTAVTMSNRFSQVVDSVRVRAVAVKSATGEKRVFQRRAGASQFAQ
jgi:hypothetical protein